MMLRKKKMAMNSRESINDGVIGHQLTENKCAPIKYLSTSDNVTSHSTAFFTSAKHAGISRGKYSNSHL